MAITGTDVLQQVENVNVVFGKDSEVKGRARRPRGSDGIETVFNRLGRVDDQSNVQTSRECTLFSPIGKPVGGFKYFNLSAMEKLQAHRHVLTNCREVDPFIHKKTNSVAQSTQGGSHSTHPMHPPEPQPRSARTKPFSSKMTNSTPIGIQGGSSTQVPAATHNTYPPHPPAPQFTTQLPPAQAPQPKGEEENTETPVQRVKQRRGWLVDVIDEHGTTKKKELTANDVLSLPHNERIVLQWNDVGQPIGEGAGLLNRFLSPIGRDFGLFPISYCSWKKVPEDYKKTVLEEEIRVKFVIESDIQKSYIYKSLGTKWRDCRQELWQARDDKARNRDELIAMVPDGLNRDQWASFIDYRLEPKTKILSQKNKENRMKQTIPHTGGSKTLARKRAEMEKDSGRKVSRGEVWTATHIHANGEFVSVEAREISGKIQEYESTMSLSQDISTQDSLARALGSKEHFGRVRGLGLGPCPSKVFGYPARYYSGMTSSSLSYMELQNEITALRSQVDEQNKKFDAMVSDEGSAHPSSNVTHHSPTNPEDEE
ncbi:putative transposase, Ptta/En/Spm, plant [Sesbania bispinosa]|nr:putative transposase, Ptta/En/Spm, plant [Sesbania bispinosa]